MCSFLLITIDVLKSLSFSQVLTRYLIALYPGFNLVREIWTFNYFSQKFFNYFSRRCSHRALPYNQNGRDEIVSAAFISVFYVK